MILESKTGTGFYKQWMPLTKSAIELSLGRLRAQLLGYHRLLPQVLLPLARNYSSMGEEMKKPKVPLPPTLLAVANTVPFGRN
jgi:hypothetical protein